MWFGANYPTGATVAITLNSVTHNATVDAIGNFSTTFNTGNLDLADSPYTVTYAFSGNANFRAVSDAGDVDGHCDSARVSFRHRQRSTGGDASPVYSWAASNSSGGTGTASLQNFALTLAPTSQPGLWANLAGGSHLTSTPFTFANLFVKARKVFLTGISLTLSPTSTSPPSRPAERDC